MNILSLFDGMSCGQIALNRAGINYETYYASEIDKHAIKVTQSNYPDTIQLGDVTRWREWDIDWSKIGLLMAGSPCQGFSFAGKQLAFDDPRSALFFVFVEIWRHIKSQNPNAYYLLENVKMKKEHELVISNYMGVHPIEINSALVSAQNRKRLYWTNIANEPYGFFGDMECVIPQPKDKGILLKDVLESDVPDKFYLSEKMVKYFTQNSVKQKENGNGFSFSPHVDLEAKGKSITTKEGSRMENNFIVASRGRNPENPKSRESSLNTEQMLEPRFDGKTNCITSVQKDNLVCEIMNEKANTLTPDAYLATGERNRDENGKAILTSMCDRRLRRLTPIECERLQTAPDNYTKQVSDTQRYRMLGNGWTVDVIVHILKYIKQTK